MSARQGVENPAASGQEADRPKDAGRALPVSAQQTKVIDELNEVFDARQPTIQVMACRVLLIL